MTRATALKTVQQHWYCIKSPEYGLLPFTCHTSRKGCIERFERWGVVRGASGEQIAKEWEQSKRDGFSCVRIKVSEARR